jgi:putative phosphoesterase
LIRPEALDALRTCDHIVHAGDIGSAAVLDALAALAPVTAIRGNNDRASWTRGLPADATLEIDGTRIYIVHDLHTIDFDPRRRGLAAVIAGHSHRPTVAMRNGVLFLNPGSAGPRRFTLPVAIAYLYVRHQLVRADIVVLG